MSLKSLRLILPACVAFLILADAGSAQTVSLTIRFANGATQFHVGEVIPIELAFSASVSETYDMSTRNYDRSGRLDMESYHVTPLGRDPLHRYYSNGAFMGGGLGSSRVLTNEPTIMREDLNEWVALDQPGHYTLYVTTGRVSHRAATKSEAIELRSNSLEFEVMPADPTWQEGVLRSAVSALDNADSADEQKNGAIRSLRFLDSPASVTELVRQMSKLPDGKRWECVAGLAGSQHQSLVVRELEQQMGTPDAAITGEYLFILPKLKFQLEHEPLPSYPDRDEQQQKFWRERMQAQNEELGRLQETLYQKTAMLVPTKRGAARAETVRTLLLRPAHEPGDIKPLAGLPEAEVADAFLALSADQQWSLLYTFWKRLKAAAMVGPLERIVEQPEIRNQMLRDVALQRLYELDPIGARPRILEEIRHPHVDNGMFTVKGETLGVLPEETLPQFDQLLASRIEGEDRRTLGLDAQLIGRYATKAILPRVKAVYEAASGQWDCVTADGLIRYFLRAEPDYGVRRLAQEPSACMTNSLPAVIRMNRWNEIEPAIIARLGDPDLNRPRQAAETLAKYGSPKAEKAMWERLRSFHRRWAPHADDLNSRPNMPREALDAMSFHFGLVEALGKAQAWVLTNEQITELENLTLGSEQDNVKRWRWHSPIDLSINLLFNERLQADINHQYSAADAASLTSKLAQYPSGTTFWITTFGPPELLAPVLREVNEVAADHGLVMESAPQR
jgi:hypothetical protein